MRNVLIAVATLALAACDRGPSIDVKNATPAEVAKAIKDSGATRAMVRPGKWSSTVKILEVSNPGLPPEIAQGMQREVGQPRTVEACLTAEQVDHPERMIGQVPGTCRYDHYRMSGGKVDGKMRCEDQGIVKEMTVVGEYASDHYTMTMTNRTSGRIGGQALPESNMKMRVDSKRLGECDAPVKNG